MCYLSCSNWTDFYKTQINLVTAVVQALAEIA